MEIRWTHIFYLYGYHPMTDPDDQSLVDNADTVTNSIGSYIDPDNANLQPTFQIKYGLLSCQAGSTCGYLRCETTYYRLQLYHIPQTVRACNLPRSFLSCVRM
jgi:hypothetical protein